MQDDELILGRGVDHAIREAAVEFWAEHGTAETAAQFQVSVSTVRRWVNDAGVVKTANNAKALEDRRRALASKLLDDVEELREQMFAETQVHHFTTKGEFNTAYLDRPTFADQKQLALAMAILIDKSAVLTGTANVRFGWESASEEEKHERLATIVDTLQQRREQRDAEEQRRQVASGE